MKIAILSDIHGNLPAFQAAIDHVQQQQVDLTVIAGDIVIGAPDSLACWRLARTLTPFVLRGNHERYLFDYGTPNALPLWDTAQFSPLHWTVKQFSDETREMLRALPPVIRIPELPDVVFCHASTRKDNDSVFVHTPDSQIQNMFANASERWIIRAHNHIGQDRVWGNRFIITCGSAGLPLDGHPTAQYLLMEQNRKGWHLRHQSVPYDVAAALRRFSETGYLEEAGPMARLFQREIATASFHVISFLRAYQHWSASGPVSLADAVDRFLTE